MFLFCFGLIVYADWKISYSSKGLHYFSLEELPSLKIGLLLGTGKYLSNGAINPYWQKRIDAAETLLKSRSIKHIVISGDNSIAGYDEPSEMRRALLDLGIDSSLITRDYAGFRTLDSVIRIKEVFQQDSVLIISQQFHTERAIYLARQHNIAAWGFNAADVSTKLSFKTRCREYLARTKALFDILLQTEPKFYGDKIDLPNLK